MIDKEAIIENLKNVFDPEIPVNIVDLGLVYDCTINKQSEKLYDINITCI